jgi:hypothetical protein
MQALTEQVWKERFAELRHVIMDEWPEVPRQQLWAVNDDYSALVALLHRSAGMSAEEVHRRLRNIDVDALDLDVEEAGEAAGETGSASVDQLRLGTGVTDDERERILGRLRKLDRRLKRFPADATELELSVKERDTPSQKVTLECWLPGFPKFVAASQLPDLRDALMDCREDLWRQIDDAVTGRGR